MLKPATAARVTLSGVGHLPNLEDPARFNAELLTFLEQAATIR